MDGRTFRPVNRHGLVSVPADTTEDVEAARSAVVADGASEGLLEQAYATSMPADAGPARQRLAGLDGVRGLAALFVVVNHVFLRAFPGYPVDRAPYWAALAFSLAVAWLVVPQPGQGAPDVKSVVVNGLLVQNLVGAPSPNRSFWSMGVEAQLYVVFPLLLLMVRRWGALVMVATVTLVVLTLGVLGAHVSRL